MIKPLLWKRNPKSLLWSEILKGSAPDPSATATENCPRIRVLYWKRTYVKPRSKWNRSLVRCWKHPTGVGATKIFPPLPREERPVFLPSNGYWPFPFVTEFLSKENTKLLHRNQKKTLSVSLTPRPCCQPAAGSMSRIFSVSRLP